MSLVTLRQLYKKTYQYVEKEISVGGWVRSVRTLKTVGFLTIYDGTFFNTLQVVLNKKYILNFKEITSLNIGTAIIVKGKFILTPSAKQQFEIHAISVDIEGSSTFDYPLQKKYHSIEYLRTILHLRPRANIFQAVFRVRSILSYAIHKFFQERDFVYVNTPIITGSDCEGAGKMFQVTTLNLNNVPYSKNGKVDYYNDFFQKQTFLTVSGQLNGEVYAQAFKNIYTFGPTFRAENSNTTRHLSEFWMIEPEMAFADINIVMDVAEDMLKFIIQYVMDHCKEEMKFFNDFVDHDINKRLNNVLNSDFGKITYTNAIEILSKNKDVFKFPVKWGVDLHTEHERYLTETVFKKPIFVVDYPIDIKAFYMKQNEDGKTVAAVDCLVPGIGEIIGGSQREDNFDKLIKRMDEVGLNKKEYMFYLDLRKYGSTRHSGFGLGLERLVMYLTGMSNIRDVLPFPRTVKNCDI